MAKMNSTSAFALFPVGQNVTFTPAGSEEKVKGKVKSWNDEKQKFSVEKLDGTGAIFLAADRLKKGQGRPPVSEEDKKNKAAAPKAQTPAKASAKDKDESEIEAAELEADDFENIGNALQMMHEMLDPDTLTLSEMMEKLGQIRETLGDMHGGIMGHHAHLTQTSEDDEVEASDEAEPEDEAAEEEVKTKPKTSLLNKKKS